MKPKQNHRSKWLALLPPVALMTSAAMAAPDDGWLSQSNYQWQPIPTGQYTSTSGPTFSHLHNGTTPDPSVSTVQVQEFNGSVGPTSLNQTTTLGLTNFTQQSYTTGSAQLGNVYWAPTSATIQLQAFYGANTVGVEFIGGTSGNQSSFNVTFQQTLDWVCSTYGISSTNNTLQSTTWIQDYNGGGGSYDAGFGYSNTNGSSPALQFQRSSTTGGIINNLTDTYVKQDGTVVRSPTIGLLDAKDTISTDNPGNGGGPGRSQTYNINLSSLKLDGSNLPVGFSSAAMVDIARNWGDADGRFHANPSFNVMATLTVNYDAWQVAAIPEPSCVLLSSLSSLLLLRRRRR